MCGQMPKWYRFVVLAAASLTQTFCLGYLSGTFILMAVYHQERYNERKISASIGTLQISLAFLAALPATYANQKLGERKLQMIAGVLMAIGVGSTAFANEPWQALLGTGILSGVAGAAIIATSYSIVSKYFPGAQLAPYATMTLLFNIGVMCWPQIMGNSMKAIGYSNTHFLTAGLLFINVICGAFFVPFEPEETEHDGAPQHKFNIRIKNRKSGTYDIPTVEGSKSIVHQNSDEQIPVPFSENVHSDEAHSKWTPHPTANLDQEYHDMKTHTSTKEHSKLSEILAQELQEETETQNHHDLTHLHPDKKIDHNSELRSFILHHQGEHIADLMEDTEQAKSHLKRLLCDPHVILYLINMLLVFFSAVGFGAICGDYMKHHRHITKDEYALGTTVLGIAMLPAGIFYLIFAKYVNFSPTMFHVCSCIYSGIVWLNFLWDITATHWYVLAGLYGIGKSFFLNNAFSNCMEITTPKKAVLLYMVQQFVDGIGGIVAPYLLTYLQVEIDPRAGFIMIGSVMIFASLMFLPISLKYLCSPKAYHLDEETFPVRPVSLHST